jgi:hypothetical protein
VFSIMFVDNMDVPYEERGEKGVAHNNLDVKKNSTSDAPGYNLNQISNRLGNNLCFLCV